MDYKWQPSIDEAIEYFRMEEDCFRKETQIELYKPEPDIELGQSLADKVVGCMQLIEWLTHYKSLLTEPKE